MTDSNIEWNKRYSDQKKMKNFQTAVQRFSIQKNADRMAENLKNGNVERVNDQLDRLIFSSGASILDIGAGPGTLAVPLAARGCSVTVVEPSVPMQNAMNEYRKIKGVDAEISIISENWEDIDANEIGQFDYIISSFAMALPDLKDALLKMNQVCKKEVHIFWFLVLPPWDKVTEALWEELHDEKYYSRPLSNLIWNALYELGIYADLEVLPMKDVHYYETFEEALAEYTDRLSAVEEKQIQIVENYLKENMMKTAKGWRLSDEGIYAHIWWEKQSFMIQE
jgi:Methylase involved in ubiquinone/menaquinone biosynthesis